MAHNKLYRNFIILQEDERGYSSSKDKALSGYAKIEVKGDKCKVSFYAQNLKREDNYSMVLICCKRDFKQLIDLGPLTINEVGKGDTSKEYYINNIAGLGISYEKISGAAICKTKGGENEFIMHGFMNGEERADNWRKFKITRVDSRKYSSKPDLEVKPKEKSSSNVGTNNKAIVLEANPEIVKHVEEVKVAEIVKSESQVIDKNEEAKLEPKSNIKLENISDNISEKLEDNIKVNDVRLQDKTNAEESINELDENRSKCNKVEKCGCEKKHDKEHKKESIEESIEEICGNLETYEGILSLEIKNYNKDVVVYGFIKDKDDNEGNWKKFKVEKKCRHDNIPTTMGESEQKIEAISTGKTEEEMKPISTSEAEQKVETPSMGEVEQKVETVGMGEGEQKPEITPKLEKIDFESYENQIKKLTSDIGFEIVGKVGQFFEKLAEGFELFKQKLNDINYCKWYKVNISNMEDLCDESNYNKYTLAYYPMLNYYPYISKTGHFLLGYKCNQNGELKYIVYAIPGSKDKNDQPYGGKTGFVTWTSDETNGNGYWLMFYDYKNSSIVVPMK